MYSIRPNLVIGFHGCDTKTYQSLLNQSDEIIVSEKPYDWLGHGMYFWENNYDRALEWAKDKHKRKEIDEPAVIGAILHIGYCLDLLDSRFIKVLQEYYKPMEAEYLILNKELPQNRNLRHDIHKDKILRELDCTTIEYMHQTILETIIEETKLKGFSIKRMFDSSRGGFTEGGPAFPGAGIYEKSHIQICIRNPNCIKGFFLPRKEKIFNPEDILKELKNHIKIKK